MHICIIHHSNDADRLEELVSHLPGWTTGSHVTWWHSDLLYGGQMVEMEVDRNLDSAQLILLLISARFIADRACSERYARALDRHCRGDALVVPILVRACSCESWLGELERLLLPRNRQALTRWEDHDEAWDTVLRELNEHLYTATGARVGARVAALAGMERDRAEVHLAEVERASQPLLSLDPARSSKDWLDRPELTKLLDALQQGESKPLILLGGPGSGKSALLARLASQLRQRGEALLAIRADKLPKDIDSIEKLRCWLDLSTAPAGALSSLASQRPTALIIDQLDALCDLVDAHTQRLSVLLELVKSTMGVPGLRVVLSCRNFEHRHDHRLQALHATPIQLEPPGLPEVQRVLRARGVEPQPLQRPFLESLRVPQHLVTFLALVGSGEKMPVFETYQQMLEELWKQRVLGADGDQQRERVLVEIATYMASEEELEAPLARFSRFRPQLNQLQAAGILRQEGTKIAFTHQTWFAFTHARSFLLGKERLCEHVRQRGGSLFVRATLWSALVNLRGASRGRYREELDALWKMPDLRTHLRTLVLEFLGHLDDPTEGEAAILLPTLRDRDFLRRVALGAMAGSQGWFRRLADRYLPVLMNGPIAAEVWGTLAMAWPFARERVLDLLERHWVREPSRAPLALWTMRELKVWDDRAVNAVLMLATHPVVDAEQSRFGLGQVVNSIAASSPEMALRVVRAVLDQELQRSRFMAEEKQPRGWPLQRYRELLEHRRVLYGLIDLAKKAPGPFLEEVWPWMVNVLDELSRPEHALIIGYRNDRVMRRRRGTDSDTIHELPEAIWIAVEGLARQDADRFMAFVQQWEASELLGVHRLLAAGLKVVAPCRALNVLEYLLGDPRRLFVGDYQDEVHATCELIEAVSPHLRPEDARRLETAIRGSYRYDEQRATDDVELRLYRQRLNPLIRLRLLRALKGCMYLSPEVRHLIEKEGRAIDDLDDDRSTSDYELREIKSPMLASDMLASRDEEILNLLQELPDVTEWSHPSKWLQGGSIQVSRELAELTKAAPDRALRLLPHLHPGSHARPAGHIVEALAEASMGHPVEEVEELLFHLEARGFASEDYRERAAWAFDKLAHRGPGLSERSCQLLETWLKDSPPEPEQRQSESQEQPRSILWSGGAGDILPHGNFTFLRALVNGYMRREPEATDSLLGVLERHLARREHVQTWRALLKYLEYMGRSDRLHGLVIRLFVEYPPVRDCEEGTHLVARMCSWADGNVLHGWLHAIRDSLWRNGAQAYGELLLLLAVRQPDLAWVREEIERVLRADGVGENDPDRIWLGLAYAAGCLWSTPKGRALSTEVLLRLVPRARGDVAAAIMTVFSRSSVLLADDRTNNFLDALLQHPSLLVAAEPYPLVTNLKAMCADDSRRVLALCNALLGESARTPGAPPKLAMAEDDLINIAVTLQRLPGYREEGLALFERLLEMELYGARRTLRELDVSPRLDGRPDE
ncbi:NACHT domain-containing protein [Sorangium sp. So ce341]|uniref:NACHT domain-containing protein n=1 Tax=Sorangium sp. So ce341 TaxID=3133302 RepID=UPI003F635BA2